ncbi:MAG: flavodoxin family protein [Bacillota bacterium]|nr:flavodoxin family protein [Bacillota bacterium]
MKVIAINGSPRENGNTKQSLEIIEKVLVKNGIEVEFVQLGGMLLHGCRACGGCFKNKNRRCAIEKDGLNDILQKVFDADGIIIGSPTYFSNVTTEVKAFIDRCGYVSKANNGLLKHKVGAPVVAVRRSGANFVYSAINFFFGIAEMPIATSSYWNMTVARDIGEIQKDEEGKHTFENLGENMAWMLKKLRND